MEKKKEMFVIIGSLLVIILSVTLAYFTVQIVGKGKEISASSADLKITFSSGSGNISSSNIEPGWSSGTSTFTVKNESKDTYKYNIVIKDLVNTFVTTGYLRYKITSADGGYNMSEFKDVPKSTAAKDTILAYSVEIAKGKTHSYSIEFKYTNSVNDQSDDMGKELSGTLYIEKGTVDLHSPYIEGTLGWQILDDNITRLTRTSFNTTFTETNTGTLYKATESIAGSTAKDVYYFAGQDTASTPINNWVKFGEFYWRIIRTNSDGSIRLLYHGTSTTATDAYIGTSAFNTTSNSPKYVGYMYGDSDTTPEEARTNTNDSTIKAYIDNWYVSNMTSYTKYLSTTAVYCNDREVGSGTYSTATSSRFNYAAYTRLYTNKTPTYDCTNDNDKFTVDASTGNGKLTYPIALMTADEIAYAGGRAYTNAPMWYYTNSTLESSTGKTNWWSLSPNYWLGLYANSWFVNGSDNPGRLYLSNVYYSGGVRPVVSLKSCTLYSTGNGTSETPYEIEETSSEC